MRHLKAGLVALLISAAVSGAALADGIKGAPPPFDKGGVKIALVSYLSQGDYFEAYEAGVARQAKVLGVDLHIFQGKQDAALQREQIEQAIALGVQGIIVSHGQPEAVKDVIQKAVDAGIKVVVKDIDVGNPKVPLISQSDHDSPARPPSWAGRKRFHKPSSARGFSSSTTGWMAHGPSLLAS